MPQEAPLPTINHETRPFRRSENRTGQMEFKRANFVSSLREKRLISEDLINSGGLDLFLINPKVGYDGLIHILIGDRRGGAHHLPTILALEAEGRTIASKIYDPSRKTTRTGELMSRELQYELNKKDQQTRENGVYTCRIVIFENDGKIYEKLFGSSMFPDTWSTEKVIKAILETYRNGWKTVELDTIIHEATIDGVKIRVVSDARTGKIKTAMPKHMKKNIMPKKKWTRHA